MNVPSGTASSAKAAAPSKRATVSKAATVSKVATASKTAAASKAPAAPRRSRGRPPTGDKRRLLLDAALRMFAERGYHGTAVPEVAAAAKVGTGTLYRHFATKEVLVNEVYRDAKARLRAAMLDGLDLEAPGERWFPDLWQRLIRFARAEPEAFRFLEMQDHAPYLDEESRRFEMTVLAPLWLAGQKLREGRPDAPLPVDVAIALVWGAFVGLLKAERLGYLRLDDAALTRAGEACWEVVAPPAVAPVILAPAAPCAPAAAASVPATSVPAARRRVSSRDTSQKKRRS